MVIGAVFQIQEGTETHSNRLTRGGARLGGSVPGSTDAIFLSKWVSILSITAGSSMQAMTLAAPPLLLQTSMSMLNTRFNCCAQVIAMDGMYAGFAGAKTGYCHGWHGWYHPDKGSSSHSAPCPALLVTGVSLRSLVLDGTSLLAQRHHHR